MLTPTMETKTDDGTKKRPFKCCVCRSTKEHRCYKCFCGKCPASTKKIPPRHEVKNRFPDSQPSNSSSVSHINEEITVSGKEQTADTSAKQHSVETSDPFTGDEHPPGFFFNGAENGYIKAILPNSLAESGSTGQPSIVKEPRGNDEVGSQKLITNGVNGWSSKSHAGTTSLWDNLAAKELRDNAGNDEAGSQTLMTKEVDGGSSKSHSGTTSIWVNLVAKEPRDNAGNDEVGGEKLMTNEVNGGSSKSHAGSTSIWDSLAAKEPRDNTGNDEVGSQKLMTNEVDGGSSKSHAVSTSIWDILAAKETRSNAGNDELGSQNIITNEVNGNSSKSHAGTTLMWDTLAAKEPRASGNQVGWANGAGEVSSWGAWPVKEPRASGYKGGWGNRAGSSPSWGSERVNEPSGNSRRYFPHQDPRRVSEPRGNQSGWVNRDFRRADEARGNKEMMADRAQDGSSRWTYCSERRSIRGNQAEWGSKVGLDSGWVTSPINDRRSNADRFTLNRDSRRERKSRGNYKDIDDGARDRSSKPFSRIPHSESGSRWNSYTGKRSRDDHRRKNDRIDDVSSRSVKKPRDDHQRKNDRVEDISSRSVKKKRGNPVVKIDRDGDGSSEQVINNHHAQSGSCEGSLTVKELSGNQEMMGCTENGFSAATEPAGYSNSGEGSVQDGKDDATNVSKSIKGVIRANRKIIDPAFASPRLAKPPRIVVSGESSSLKKKFYSSQKFTKVGPASQIIWKGNFEFLDFSDDKRLCEGYLAHTAARVNNKVYKFTSEISGNLQFKIHPRRAFMPEIFKLKHPNARDIALYFYPQRYKRSIKEYGELLQLLEQHDLMLRSVMEQVELLVFSSRLLHSDFQSEYFYYRLPYFVRKKIYMNTLI